MSPLCHIAAGPVFAALAFGAVAQSASLKPKNWGAEIRFSAPTESAWVLSSSRNLSEWYPLQTNIVTGLTVAQLDLIPHQFEAFRWNLYRDVPTFLNPLTRDWGQTNITFRAAIAAELPVNAQWRRGENILKEEVIQTPFASLVITNATWRENGEYWLVASNRAGATTSGPVLVEISIPPIPPVSIKQREIDFRVRTSSQNFPEAWFRFSAFIRTYAIRGGSPFGDSHGNFTYWRTGDYTAEMELYDSLRGEMSVHFTFSDLGVGTFVIEDGGESASGTFQMVQ